MKSNNKRQFHRNVVFYSYTIMELISANSFNQVLYCYFIPIMLTTFLKVTQIVIKSM